MARFWLMWREDPGAKLPFSPLYIIVLLLLLVTYLCLGAISSTDTVDGHPLAGRAALIVFYGEVLGLLAGLAWVQVSDRFSAIECKYNRDISDEIGLTHPYEGWFIAFTTLIVSAYVLSYSLAELKFSETAPPEEWPISKYVAAITAVTIFLLTFFAVKYAAHVRMTRVLELGLEKLPGNRVLLTGLRKAVFRGDQLYEPAGNIFVTLGITATFLGLALGLVILDIPALFGGTAEDPVSNGSAEIAAAAADPAATRRAAVASLRSFVGCMGLALGVSMLGVMTALAAQGLRARGATSSTEDLLSQAASALERISASEAAEAEKAAKAEAAREKAAKAKRAKAAKAAKQGQAGPEIAPPLPPAPSEPGNGHLPVSAEIVATLPSEGPPPQPASPARVPAAEHKAAAETDPAKGSDHD